MFIDNDTLEIVATVVLSVIAFIPCFLIAKKNIMEKNLLTPIDKPVWEFSETALCIYVALVSVAYFILGEADRDTLLSIDFSQSFSALWSAGKLTDPILMLSTLVLFFILFKICTGRKNKA